MATRVKLANGGAGSATIVDVARTAKVSLGTASRVINRHPKVAPELRERVLVACRRLGFVPRTQHRSIGVVVDLNFKSPFTYGPAMLGLLMRELASRDYTMEVIELEELALAYEAHVEGIIGVIFDERITKLPEIPNLPILTINQPVPGEGIHSICSDHYQQGVLAMKHLLANGHSRIAFLEDEAGNWGSRQRLAGYRDTLRTADVPFDPALICYTRRIPLYVALNRLINKGVTAIANFSEDNELETVHILTHILKLSIPKDISVVSMENQPVLQYLSPPQTVIRQPLDQLATLAVEKVLELSRAGGARQPVNVMLPCELVERESVAHIGAPLIAV